MSDLSSLLRLCSARQTLWKPYVSLGCFSGHRRRSYSDKPDVTPNQVVGPENEERVRVRRARPADVPRILRFVRENAKTAGLVVPHSASNLILCDYVTRALAQGHSMLAEQQESRRGWGIIRGLALGVSVCPWDAPLLERWARCIKCSRSRKLMQFTAHCLRTPALHSKYGVNNILQVIMILPHGCPKNAEVVHILAKNAIQRGRDVGFSVLRFDVTDDSIGSILEQMELKKEWQLMYDIFPDLLKDDEQITPITQRASNRYSTINIPVSTNGNYVTVYSARTNKESETVKPNETNPKNYM